MRLQKNMLATLLLSLGTPMILGGDEIGRTQGGNNNAYCQDNATSWYDYSLLQANRGLFDFVSNLIRFRLNHPAFLRPEFYTGKDSDFNRMPDITWLDESGAQIDWAHIGRTFSLCIDGSHAEIQADRDDNDFLIVYNAAEEGVRVVLHAPPDDKHWYRVLDTSIPLSDGLVPEGIDTPAEETYLCGPRSMVVFLSRS
jgi:glycogen operon protein